MLKSFREYTKILNKTGTGYVGYQIMFVVKENSNYTSRDIYKYYLESLSSKKYLEFFKSLSVEELADIRKVVVFNLDINSKINRTASKKLFDFITFEIKTRNIKKIAEA